MLGLMDGFTFLELAWGIPGPVAGMLFADSGATVIKVEPPDGDPFRGFKPYHVWNRGKRSLTIDLKKKAGQELFHDLAAGADVLVESFQPGEADKLGLGYETLHARFPRLVYTSITGYGQSGSRKDTKAPPRTPDLPEVSAAGVATVSTVVGPASRAASESGLTRACAIWTSIVEKSR